MRNPFTFASAFCILISACGETSRDDGGDRAMGGKTGSGGAGANDAGGPVGGFGGKPTDGTAGTAGTAGVAGAAGQGGVPCIPSRPGTYPLCDTPAGAPCDEPGDFCVLVTTCSAGHSSDLMECKPNELGATTWQLPAYCCDELYEVCEITDLTCIDGKKKYFLPGDSPTQGCPLERPALGDSCTPGENGAPTCGYPCEDGTGWSIAGCESVGKQSAFLFDEACKGDCSKALAALGDFVEQNSKCSVAADCKIHYTACPPIAEHCSGAAYLAASANTIEWVALLDAYDSCDADAAFGCEACDALAPPPACKNGLCVPGP